MPLYLARPTTHSGPVLFRSLRSNCLDVTATASLKEVASAKNGFEFL